MSCSRNLMVIVLFRNINWNIHENNCVFISSFVRIFVNTFVWLLFFSKDTLSFITACKKDSERYSFSQKVIKFVRIRSKLVSKSGQNSRLYSQLKNTKIQCRSLFLLPINWDTHRYSLFTFVCSGKEEKGGEGITSSGSECQRFREKREECLHRQFR